MDDDGYLRKPTWLRAWPLEDRVKFARVPSLFQPYLDAKVEAGETREWLENYERGQVLIVRDKNTSHAAKVAACVLGQLLKKGESGRWITSEGYVSLYKEEWADEDMGERWRQLKYISRGFDVLVLDGLGEEANTEFERKILGSLIKGRYEREKTTIITTPHTVTNLAVYGGRVAGYLMEGTKIDARQ